MEEASIAQDFRIGNTRIKIADSCCKQTAEEIENILCRIAQQAQRHMCVAAESDDYHGEEGIA